MRLSDKEKKTILDSIRKIDSSAQVFLHGSRTQPELLGGDIDLLVLSDLMGIREKAVVLAEIKQNLGDQKIDLKICTHKNKDTDPFVGQILKNSRPLV